MSAPLGNQHNTKWLPEWDEALRSFFAAGMSGAATANAICAKFKIYLSRNAIIGRAARLGVKSTAARAGPPKRAMSPQKIRVVVARIASPKSQADLPALRCIEVAPFNVALLDLAPDGCRWPYGDDPFVFCNHGQLEGSSYCAPHFALSVGIGTTSERAAHRLQAAE